MQICNIVNSSSRITSSEFVEEAKYVYSAGTVANYIDCWNFVLLRAWDLGYQAIEAVGQRNIALHKVQADGFATLNTLSTDALS